MSDLQDAVDERRYGKYLITAGRVYLLAGGTRELLGTVEDVCDVFLLNQ